MIELELPAVAKVGYRASNFTISSDKGIHSDTAENWTKKHATRWKITKLHLDFEKFFSYERTKIVKKTKRLELC